MFSESLKSHIWALAPQLVAVGDVSIDAYWLAIEISPYTVIFSNITLPIDIY
jgi:hypothetical protein